MAEREKEWVQLTNRTAPELADAIAEFEAPDDHPAGVAATKWLHDQAVELIDRVGTWVLLVDGRIAAFHAVTMNRVELTQRHQKKIGVVHPEQGAVLIAWVARAADTEIGLEEILMHVVGVAQIAARHVPAVALVVDPYDAGTDRMWRERYGFLSTQTKLTGEREGLKRLWRPLYPDLES